MDRKRKHGIVYLSFLTLVLSSCASLSELGVDVDNILAQKNCDSRDCWSYLDDEQQEEKTKVEKQEAENRVHTAIEIRDIVLGMSKTEVIRSWGEPVRKEYADRSGLGNERWIYGARYSLIGERTVVFERGVVVGWYR